MTRLTVSAWAKLNLTLDLLGLRDDGYHALDMLMQTVSLHDDVTIQTDTGAPWRLSCTDAAGTPLPGIPYDARNLAWQAAVAFYRTTGLPEHGIELRITKRIPAEAGLAGGSADAAAVLRGLNAIYGTPLARDELCALAAQCGSDTPFCVMGGTARVRGRGELVEPVALTTVQHYVICKPPFGVSTPKLFALSDRYAVERRPEQDALLRLLQEDRPQLAGSLLCNALEPVALRLHPQLAALKQALLAAGACGAQMTGSGSAVFGLFPGAAAAKQAAAQLTGQNFSVFYAHSV